jgi:hypothetical protein
VVTLSSAAQAAQAAATTGNVTIAQLASNAESGLLTTSDIALQLVSQPGAASDANATTSSNGPGAPPQAPAQSSDSKLDVTA